MSRNRQRSFKKQIKKDKQREKEIKNQNKKSMRFDNKKEPEKILIGVYGFLRKGMQNHEQLDEDSPVAVYETAPEFTLYDIEGFACLDKKGSSSVLIELYNVDRAIFQSLEWHNNLEGNILDYTNNYELYKLERIMTPFGLAYFFLLDDKIVDPLKNGIVVESGNWLDYYQTKSVANTLFSLLAKKDKN